MISNFNSVLPNFPLVAVWFLEKKIKENDFLMFGCLGKNLKRKSNIDKFTLNLKCA